MLRYMLDTDTVSYAMKGNASVLKQLQKVPIGDVCISAISHSELAFGTRFLRLRREIEEDSIFFFGIFRFSITRATPLRITRRCGRF